MRSGYILHNYTGLLSALILYQNALTSITPPLEKWLKGKRSFEVRTS